MTVADKTKRVYAKPLVKTCEHCGVVFNTRCKKQLYCCKGCSQKSQRIYGKVPCRWCGTLFKETTSQKLYCSWACYSAKRAAQLLVTKCDWCGAELSVKGTQKKSKRHFCSQACYGAWKSADMRRRSGPLRTLRGTAEYRKWVRSIYERDGFVCAVCGGSKPRLDVHHIRKAIDFPELLMEDSNAITLCRYCHLAISRHEQDYEEIFCDILEVNADIKPIYTPRPPEEPPVSRTCTKCGTVKILEEFAFHPSCKWNRQHICKVCRAVYRKDYQARKKVTQQVTSEVQSK